MSQLVRNVVTTGRKLNEEDGVKVCRRIEVRKSFSGRECCLDSWIQERIKISTGGGGQKRDGER